MLIKKPESDELINLRVDFNNIIGDWVNLFGDGFLKSDYMKNLMAFLYLQYTASPLLIRPSNKYNVFRAFRETPYMECRVVIMTEFPTTSIKSSGLGLGNSKFTTETAMTPQLYQFKKCIENTCHRGLNLNFDNSLREIAEEGVLLINTALTCTATDREAHAKYWDKFMTTFLTKFQEQTAHIVFAFIGDACKYSSLIDDGFHSIIAEPLSIEECVEKKEYWSSEIFTKINDALFDMHGMQYSRIPF